ncbi:DNA replication complex GINS protein PSF3 isoform X2 [Thrips palmi]|uniref:DNA replication complex GINS protein PSF3 n=1 Tax=Thrips palmi TaxID=161013 RepID=A0A6P8ZQC4_THRPL|nr:DNA replication complex GINS protein PSF3 isoform X2 [Thrips palmi]
MFCHGLISYVPNYFSIPDILATQEKVPCTFEVQVKHLGFLDPGSDKRDIEVGTNIELPFWMASVLKTQRPAIADVGLPKIFKESYRDILKADPVVVDLHKLAPYFYEFGMSLCMLNHRESPEIVNVLVESFKQRFRKILDWAQHSNIEVPESKKLDNAEKIIYQAGREVGSSLHLWLTEGGSLIMAAGMVMQHKKMKLTQRDLLQ